MRDESQPLLQAANNGTQPTKSKKKSDANTLVQIDGGLGWLVVLACFLTNGVIDGVTYSFGMLMKPLMEDMKEGNFGCATIGSIQVSQNRKIYNR